MPLAEDGFEVDSELERSLKIYGSDIDRNSSFFKGKRTVREGDVVKQPALAKTLKGIRDKVNISIRILLRVYLNKSIVN